MARRRSVSPFLVGMMIETLGAGDGRARLTRQWQPATATSSAETPVRAR